MNPQALLPLTPGAGEVLLVLSAALLLFGADRLPGIARSLGNWLHKIRCAADDFQDQLLDSDNPSLSDRSFNPGARETTGTTSLEQSANTPDTTATPQSGRRQDNR